MSIADLLSTLAMMIALAVLIIALPIAIRRNVRQGVRFRQRLASRIESLRLSRMLAALGVDVNRYLHSTRVSEIETQARRCEQCDAKTRCDEELSTGIVEDAESYCPNYPDLKQLPPGSPTS